MSRTNRAGALVGVIGIVLVGCAPPPPPPVATLDPAAAQACEDFAPLGGPVRRGELEGPALYRALQGIYDTARPSENEEVAQAAQRVLSAAISDDRPALTQAVTDLQQACALPFR